MIKNERFCKCGCGSSIQHKHSNALFLNKKHKDFYWNMVNPRGIYSYLKYESEIYDHPFDLD
jgi:hypothetical protein